VGSTASRRYPVQQSTWLPTSDCVLLRVLAYARHAGPGADKKPPFAVAVAAADDLFVVELGETAGRDAPYWEVVIFDRRWRRIASYGGGS
jgi:hypothetical protein